MGNQLAPHSANHKQIDELQNACVEAPLGGGRVLRTLLYKHDVGKLVVKVFNKQGESLDLKPYKQQLNHIHERLKCIVRRHVWPFQEFVETENTGFMIRPFIFQNLYDRICSRPFLTHIEKCWVAYQLLDALVQCHSQGVCHGDIKSENALVTSWNWVFLADFASYKPTYLPADNPADFSYFFDIAGERRCHVAPERFFETRSLPQGELTTAMDIFSLGCVIAELFLDGKGLFEFSELHSYKKGQFDPRSKLTQVEANVQELILHMIQLDPKSRLTSSEYLTRFTPRIFPEYFSRALSPFFGSLLYKDPDARIALLSNQFLHLKNEMMMTERTQDDQPPMESSLSQRRVTSGTLTTQEAIYDPDTFHGKPYTIRHLNDKELIDSVEQLKSRISKAQEDLNKIGQSPCQKDLVPLTNRGRLQGNSPQTPESSPQCPPPESLMDGMVLLLVLLCSQIRCVRLLETKRTALFLLSDISSLCRTECRLDRVLPYFLSMLSESAASIRFLALHHLLRLLSSVRSTSSAFKIHYERRLYQEYILPCLSMLPTDPEEIVRVEYAASIPELAMCAHHYLHKELSHKKGDLERKEERELPLLRERIHFEFQELISGDKSTSGIRQALSESFWKLAKFQGAKKIPDLLPLLTTFLNDSDWQLRCAFFTCIETIEEKPPKQSMQILKPLLEIGMQDKDPTIVASALSLATHLCQNLHPKKEIVLSISRLATPLLAHNSIAVRAKTMEFLRVVNNLLGPSDSFARLLPMTKGLLPQNPFILNSEQLIMESLLVQDLQGEGELTSPRSQGSIDCSERSYGSRFGSHDEDYLFPKTVAYSTRLDASLIQRGLTRHKASLDKVAQNEIIVNRLNPDHVQDVRSLSALMNFELCGNSVKHGNVDSANAVSGSSTGITTNHNLSNAIADAMNTRINETHFSVHSMDGWKPEGILLGHYAEHRRCVNEISVSRDPNNPFFVTASNDGTVKVWDLNLINDDLKFASCATYAAQNGEILSVSVCEDGKSVASASCNGTLHVWQVNYALKANNGVNASSSSLKQFSGISNRHEVCPDEGAILNVQQWGALLLYTTQRGILHGWDLRMKKDAWHIKTTPKEGLIRSVGVDPVNGGTWIVTGSSQGMLTLWDVRFQLQVKKWFHPSRNEVLDVSACGSGLDQMRSMGIKTPGPFVYIVCGGANEVGLWDVQDGSCKQVFRAIPREETEVRKMELPSALAASRRETHGVGQIQNELESRHQKLRLSHSPNEGIRCVLPIGGGSVITGGYDKFIRVWDGIEPKRSFPMSGPSPRSHKEQGMYSFQCNLHFVQGVPIINECCFKSHYHQMTHEGFSRKQSSHHNDCVTDLSIAHVREQLLISASRDGVVKIWK
eukprot:g4412.t1